MPTHLHNPGVTPTGYKRIATGTWRGVTYTLATTNEHGLLCYVGAEPYEWVRGASPTWAPHSLRMALRSLVTGQHYSDPSFVAHVDRVADRALDRIGS